MNELPTSISVPDVSIPSCARQINFGTRILALIDKLEETELERKQKLRTHFRYPIVMPVEIRRHNCSSTVQGISRNLSHGGIGLITDQPVNELSIRVLELHPEGDSPSEVVAECRWCQTFGERFWMSGWEFLRISGPSPKPQGIKY